MYHIFEREEVGVGGAGDLSVFVLDKKRVSKVFVRRVFLVLTVCVGTIFMAQARGKQDDAENGLE